MKFPHCVAFTKFLSTKVWVTKWKIKIIWANYILYWIFISSIFCRYFLGQTQLEQQYRHYLGRWNGFGKNYPNCHFLVLLVQRRPLPRPIFGLCSIVNLDQLGAWVWTLGSWILRCILRWWQRLQVMKTRNFFHGIFQPFRFYVKSIFAMPEPEVPICQKLYS